jgi:hypothetical protein
MEERGAQALGSAAGGIVGMRSERLGIDVKAMESDMGEGLIQKSAFAKGKANPRRRERRATGRRGES